MLYTPQKTNVISEESFFDRINEVEKLLSEYADEGYMDSFDGLKIYYRNYLVKDALGSIVIVHGFTEYCVKYTELVWYFINAGYNVFTYDHRGHGLSEREVDGYLLAHVNSFDDYVFDLECFVNNIVIPKGGKKNINIFSHSMGGSVATLYLMRCGNTVSRAVLSSPMVVPYTQKCPVWVLKILLKSESKKYGWNAKFKYASDFNPNHPFEKSHDSSYPRFRHNLDVRLSDVRYQTSSSTNRWMYEAVTVNKKMLSRKGAKYIKAKTLLINSGLDNVVRPKPQVKLACLIGAKYVSIPEAKHSAFITASPKLEEYLDIVFEFLHT